MAGAKLTKKKRRVPACAERPTPELTDMQQAFCLEYVKDRNATAAARRAGYAVRSAGVTAAKMLKMERVQAYINALDPPESGLESNETNRGYVLRGLRAIADNPKTGDTNKLKALELIGKHLGMFGDSQQALTQIAIVINGQDADLSDYAR